MSIRPLKKEVPGRYRSADGDWLFVKSPAGQWSSCDTWHTYYRDEDEAFGMVSRTLCEQVEQVEDELHMELRMRKR